MLFRCVLLFAILFLQIAHIRLLHANKYFLRTYLLMLIKMMMMMMMMMIMIMIMTIDGGGGGGGDGILETTQNRDTVTSDR